MKILYKTVTWSHFSSYLKKEEVFENYEPIEIAYCCDMMKKAYEDNFVTFSDTNSYPFSNIQTPTMYIKKLRWEDYEYMPIYNCPFCGNLIILTEISRMKKIEKKRVVQKEETFYEEVHIT